MAVSKVINPLTGGATGGTLPDSVEDTVLSLSAALTPEQSLAEDVTSWTVEWPAASGGTGGFVYSLDVRDEDGISVTPDSGSNNGPYIVPVEEGKAYVARLQVSDSNGQTVESSAVCRVAGYNWILVQDYDLTGLDNATLTGTTNLYKGSALFGPEVKVVDHASNGGTVSAGVNGVTVDGGATNSALNVSFDMEDIIPDILTKLLTTTLWIDITFTNLGGYVSGSDGIRCGIVDSSGNFSTGTSYDVRGDMISGSTINWKTESNASTSSWLGTLTTYSTNVVSILLIGGFVAQAFLQQNSSTLPDAATINSGGRTIAKTIAVGSAPLFSSGLRVGMQSIWRANTTITRIRVHKLGGL